jgi:predicted Zn-dependent protease
MKQTRIYFLIIILVAGLTGGCAINKADIGGFNLISIPEEKELGAKFAVEVEKEHQILSDKEAQEYVNRVGKRLLTGARSVDFDYTFAVVKDDGVNAFAIPGGHTYIQTGLIKMAANEDELAGVMAHEINHVVARHGTRQLTQQYGYGLVLQLVLGDNPNMLAQLAASLFGKAGMMHYSREMESQADYLGVETMYKAGFNPEGMATFFGKLEKPNQAPPGQLTKFFSSHPYTADRLQSVRSEIATLPSKAYRPEDPETFKRLKARLK